MIESYPVSWFEKAIVSHDHVEGAMAIDNREVRIVRKELNPITVVPVTSDFLVRQDLDEVLADRKPTLVVLINRAGHYAWDARELAEERAHHSRPSRSYTPSFQTSTREAGSTRTSASSAAALSSTPR